MVVTPAPCLAVVYGAGAAGIGYMNCGRSSSDSDSRITEEVERHLRRIHLLESSSKNYTSYTNENDKVERNESDLELDFDALGSQSSRFIVSSKSEVNDDYEQKLIDLKESRNRLRQKTKQLLKQYRHKRSLLERKDQQLTAQRAGLIRLQTLHQSVESNHYIVIHHLGQQIIQTARLVSTLWPEKRGHYT